jgi:hypothetical protein
MFYPVDPPPLKDGALSHLLDTRVLFGRKTKSGLLGDRTRSIAYRKSPSAIYVSTDIAKLLPYHNGEKFS